MTAPDEIVLSETGSMWLNVQFVDVDDYARTGRAVAEVTNQQLQVAMGVLRGFRGYPGPPLNVVGTLANAAARPALGSGDANKSYWRTDLLAFDTWTGSTWVTSPSLRGPVGPSGPIRQAADYDDTTAPGTGSVPEWTAGGKYAPVPYGSIVVERQTGTGTNQGNQTIVGGTDTAVAFSSLRHGTGSVMTWSASQPTRFVATRKCLVNPMGGLTWQNNGNGGRGCYWRRSSSTGTLIDTYNASQSGAAAGTQTRVTASTAAIPVDLGDYLELIAFQNSGGNLDLVPDGHGVRVSLSYAGPQ